jgi:hypothetical protein
VGPGFAPGFFQDTQLVFGERLAIGVVRDQGLDAGPDLVDEAELAGEARAGRSGAERRVDKPGIGQPRMCLLDRELASGVAPEANAGLAARAVRLTSMAFRRELAGSLRRMLAAAGAPRSRLATSRRMPQAAQPTAGVSRQPHVPIHRARITRSAPELAELAGYLVQPGPVPVRGVAMVCELLADGRGPLYRAACRDDLDAMVLRAAQALIS